MSKIQVIESQQPVYYNVTSFEIIVSSIIFNSSAVLIARCYDKNIMLFDKVIDLTNDEYMLWGNDDNYIINLVASKLGLILVDQTNLI